MKPRFHPVLVAFCGCVLGLLVGFVAQVVHVRNFAREQANVTAEFERRGQSPPLLIDLQKPSAYPMIFSAGFGIAGMLLYLASYAVVVRSSE